MKEQIEKLRDELYEAIPTGPVDAFDLIRVINVHISKLDELAKVNNNIVKPDVSGRTICPQCKTDDWDGMGQYRRCNKCGKRWKTVL